MSVFIPRLFEASEYFIDEKVSILPFRKRYRIHDPLGLPAGQVIQKISSWHKFLRIFLEKNRMPFQLEITDASGTVKADISRGWTFWLSRITIRDPRGVITGYIHQRFNWMKSRFIIFDSGNIPVAEINGDWNAWKFSITDSEGSQIGTINKKWSGRAGEFFTSADKYHVTLKPDHMGERNKLNILATAIAIDMILKGSR